MQSIYRFRDAEVRLFLDAQATRRIGNVPVRFVDLARNFRSQGTLVEWVNRVFPHVLAPRSDPWRGAVSFAPAAATHAAVHDARADRRSASRHAEAEAERVVARVQAALARRCPRDIAILVRARAAISTLILPALRAARIAFAAVELDSLGDAPVDARPGRRSRTRCCSPPIAWRRSRCCARRGAASSLADLLAAGAARCARAARHPRPATGEHRRRERRRRARLERVAQALLPAFAERGRAPLRESRARRVARAGRSRDRRRSRSTSTRRRRFFALLAAHEAGGDVRDWKAFATRSHHVFATPDARTRCARAGDDAASRRRDSSSTR